MKSLKKNQENSTFNNILNIIKYFPLTLTRKVKDLYGKNVKALKLKKKLKKISEVVNICH